MSIVIRLKFDLKKIFNLNFFPVKAESMLFTTMKKRRQKGDIPLVYEDLKYQYRFAKNDKSSKFQR